ncbi:MAG: ATP-binding protein [Desulfobacterales bacterium]
MQRLITNLLENAIKYNKKGGTVTISVTSASQQVTIKVEDTGLGMADDDLPRILNGFTGATGAAPRQASGWAQSLKAIVKAFNGEIE